MYFTWFKRIIFSSHFLSLCKLDINFKWSVLVALRSSTFYGLNYRPQRSCGKVMFSQASVILSRGCLADTHPSGQTPPRQTPPQHTAIAADGTHHTGMHSCHFCVHFPSHWMNLYIIQYFNENPINKCWWRWILLSILSGAFYCISSNELKKSLLPGFIGGRSMELSPSTYSPTITLLRNM